MRYILIIIVMLPATSANIVISEIMANPPADESLNEWVEIFNNGSTAIDISGWEIGDGINMDNITGALYGGEGTVMQPFSYAIITDSETRVYDNFKINDALKLYVGKNIGTGLKNNGGEIIIVDHDKVIDNATYSETKNGFSWAFDNDTWSEAYPTPGYGNYIRYGCDWGIEIVSDTAYRKHANFTINVFKVYGGRNDILLSREISDVYGNSFKEYDEIKLDKISYHRKLDYSPLLEPNNVYVIKANISSECDINSDNNAQEKIIYIAGGPLDKQPNITIENVMDLGKDNTAKLGQMIRIKLSVYTGINKESSISIKLEGKADLAKVARINVNGRYNGQAFVMPFPIGCGSGNEAGIYNLVAEGMNLSASREIYINGTECIEEDNDYKATSLLNITEGNIIYMAKERQIKGYNIYFFIAVLILVIISLMKDAGK